MIRCHHGDTRMPIVSGSTHARCSEPVLGSSNEQVAHWHGADVFALVFWHDEAQVVGNCCMAYISVQWCCVTPDAAQQQEVGIMAVGDI